MRRPVGCAEAEIIPVVTVLKVLLWVSLGLLVWTHLGYALFAAALARIRPRPLRKADVTPEVSVIVAAHDEESVIEQRIENLLAQDYPPKRLHVVVASDGSTDRTDELVRAVAAREPRVSLLRRPREGKVAAQNAAVRETEDEIVAFTDANSLWAPDTLRALVRAFADEHVAYACGQLRLAANQPNQEGLYWRYETWLRKQEAALGSITAGNGAVYALRRADYVEHRFGHDFGLPYQLVSRGRRAVYVPEAVAHEKAASAPEEEYRRKVRMFSRAWRHVLAGRIFRGVGALYAFELFSHRILRYASGLLHVVLLATSLALVRQGLVYEIALSAQLAWLVLAAAGRLRIPIPGAKLAYYYFLVTWATVAGLLSYLRSGVPVTWEKAEGTR
jgi:cellulose synthase/poly-beta-1,6-N-acetylglucosamine synthase-like glycosyltransferase